MEEKYILHTPTYERTVRLFTRLRKLLGINIKLHGDQALLAQGDIFLFNHFARIETFLPHYLIHRETGTFCRCIAAKSLFKGNEAFRNFLVKVGVIPNDHDNLLPLLVAEIIRGRKVVIFPEGGMVKDRRVLDDNGNFSVYSRKAKTFRKHHSGAAVLAIAVDVFKTAVRLAEENENWQQLDDWVEMLELKNREHLLFAVHRPTTIIPGNITFYPINTSKNFINQGIDLLKTDLNPRINEELLIEANLLLKNTDMDMRLGTPLCLAKYRPWWEQKLINYIARRLETIDDFFSLGIFQNKWLEKIVRKSIKFSSEKLRDRYMENIYLGVTINLSHLASTILLDMVARNQCEIDTQKFFLAVYLATKHIQKEPGLHLHRSLRNTDSYSGLLDDGAPLQQFLEISINSGLIIQDRDRLIIQEKVKNDFAFDTVRIENTIQVYANEVAPIYGVTKAVKLALEQVGMISQHALSYHLHDDELRSYDWNQHYYSKSRFDDINKTETASESGRPFFELPELNQQELGIILVHGFLASPAEVKPFSEKLLAKGFPVYGVRLPGHGTSPADLRERSWQDWVDVIQRGYEILSPHAKHICLVGFSTGGALSLIHTAHFPKHIHSVVAINPPIKFRNKNMMFVPLLHGVSKVVRWVSSLEGVMPYRNHDTEHPRINYRKIPVRGLYELKQMNEYLMQRLAQISCPCLIIQSTDDPVLTADSHQILIDRLIHADVSNVMIDSNRHGILYEDIGETHSAVIKFLQSQMTSISARSDTHEEKLQWGN